MIKIQVKSFAKDNTLLSKEDEAANWLKENLQEELVGYPNAKGTIYIMTSIRIFGQSRNDIDMLIMGFIENLILKKVKTKNYGVVNELEIKSFICNVELKSHTATAVKREGTDYIVSYSGIPHNASQQCSEAKFSILRHLEDQLSIKPFICDVLWFNGLSKADIVSMRGSALDNGLHCGFNFIDLINVILLQANVKKETGKVKLDCFNNGEKEYHSIINLFSAERKPLGLTKQKFELLSQKDTDAYKLLQDAGNKLTIITGRAGTGKTVQLLQLAFLLAYEHYTNRCLILTYNHALVSDIRRLIDYTPMPSKVDGRTVSIITIHSFFHTIMKETGIVSKSLNPLNKTYDKEYNNALQELYKFIVKTCEKEDIETLKDMAETPIDWDYILIDEAQDFCDIEKKILIKIYGANRLIVADGVDQFMRTTHRQIWEKDIDRDLVKKVKPMELERRQKANLVSFVNAFAKLSNLDWKVRPNNNLPGGEIKIYPQFNNQIYKNLYQNCNNNNCENYDILILQPPTQVATDEKGNRYFKKAKTNIETAKIPIFDGINNHNRTTYPTKDQCRIYQYDSCRGLEGWCVVCADFDELIQYKLNTYKANEDELGLDPDIAKMRNVFLWALMPLTRPIDTLVITLSNTDSEVGKMLKKLADTYPDFIEWNF